MNSPDPALSSHLRTGWFIAVDPGVEHPAVAIFDHGTLVHASRVRLIGECAPAKLRQLEEGERVRLIVKAIAAHVAEHAGHAVRWGPPASQLLAVVNEWPQAYSAGKSKNSASQLFPLAAIGAGVAIRFDVPAVSPLPSEWIGQVPKDDTQPDGWNSVRGRMIKNRTRPEELGAFAVGPSGYVAHDTIDAAGLGYWVLGRLERTYGLAA